MPCACACGLLVCLFVCLSPKVDNARSLVLLVFGGSTDNDFLFHLFEVSKKGAGMQ